jgi:hypothetical protein
MAGYGYAGYSQKNKSNASQLFCTKGVANCKLVISCHRQN